MLRPHRRTGFTLLELLVVIAILAVLSALLISAVQKARDAATRVLCANNLGQITIGVTNYQTVNGWFPPSNTPPLALQVPPGIYPYGGLSWMGLILPYIDQQNGWRATQAAFRADPYPNNSPPHVMQGTVISLYTCPTDGRVLQSSDVNGNTVAFTSYLGVNGTNVRAHDGILYEMAKVRPVDVTDGLSNTLLVGERPPSADLVFGWWYAGAGQWDSSQGLGLNTGSLDVNLGAAEINLKQNGSASPGSTSCPDGPYSYQPGSLTNECDMFHFWSLHPNGANFAFADGSVRFLSYAVAPLLPALATRAGGEQVALPN